MRKWLWKYRNLKFSLRQGVRNWLFLHFEIYIIEKYHFPLWCPISLSLEQIRWRYVPVHAISSKNYCATFIECFIVMHIFRLMFRRDKFRVVKYKDEYKGSYYYNFCKCTD